jgi:hypothetical protein
MSQVRKAPRVKHREPLQPYAKCVFLNVPFDPQYETLFHALIFAIHDCGFIARCARECDNASETRFEKLMRIIGGCKYGVHDISRTTLDPTNRLPRFNMPLELGIFLGAQRFGQSNQRKKVCLVLEREDYQYQKYCSDLAGQDVRAHGNLVENSIRAVRNWLKTNCRESRMPGASSMVERYVLFLRDLPALCSADGLDHEDLPFLEYRTLVFAWLSRNPSLVAR